MTPFLVGTLLAVGAATAFGLTAPLVQRFGNGTGPFATATLLYVGAALVSLRGRRKQAIATRGLVVRLGLAAAFGAFFAPACLAFGLQRSSGTAASLTLNLESVLTLLLAASFLGEEVGRRFVAALASMLAGGAILVVGAGVTGESSWLGLSAVALATLGWALDNVISRPLAELSPAWVVLRKASVGAFLSLFVSLARHEAWPLPKDGLALVACGATGYGASLLLYLSAQRRIGAGRTGSVFAVAPFVGALAAFGLGQGTLGPSVLAAAGLFGLGAYLHATERHEHVHTHDSVEHDHRHRHDDGHHDHVHDPPVVGEHSHPHRHDRVTHEHPHAPDVHHTHRH